MSWNGNKITCERLCTNIMFDKYDAYLWKTLLALCSFLPGRWPGRNHQTSHCPQPWPESNLLRTQKQFCWCRQLSTSVHLKQDYNLWTQSLYPGWDQPAHIKHEVKWKRSFFLKYCVQIIFLKMYDVCIWKTLLALRSFFPWLGWNH